MVLTGGMMTAKEAETAGLVARVVPNDQVRTAAFYTPLHSHLTLS
jgi:enoyl-CoA hydratase/carnithine racemase